jgi:hypothetical protein
VDEENKMPRKTQLVCQHLENIKGEVFEEYQEIIREFVSHRHGIYALYKGSRLYYVGLATNLSARLKAHLEIGMAATGTASASTSPWVMST